MMFPHDGKIVIIDQLTYYEKRTSSTPNCVLPFVGSHTEVITSFTEAGPGIFKTSSLLGTYHSDPPLIEATPATPICMMSSLNTPQPQELVPETPSVVATDSTFLPYTIT